MPTFPALSTAKLIGLAIAAAAVLSFVLLAFHWKAQAADRKAELATICTETRAAAGKPKLDCKQVALQIKYLGEAVGTLKGALRNQNAAVAAMGEQTKAQQEMAAKAARNAAQRAEAALATSRRLSASAAHSAPERQCEPSEELKGAWR